MGFVLTEEEASIQRTARGLVDARGGAPVLRRLRDERDPLGCARELWAGLVELGLVGLALPEARGGAGLGLCHAGLVAEELGRTLSPTPFSAHTIAARAVAREAGSEVARELLPSLCDGSRTLALAHDEGVRHRARPAAVTLSRAGDGFVLDGEKSFVPFGAAADQLLVSAAHAGGVALVVVPRAQTELTPLSTIDSHGAARARFRALRVPASSVLSLDAGASLARALDEGALLLSAEMLGGAREAFRRTVEYLKQRRQFGVPIGSFQALKHRAATMFCDLELSRSIVREGLSVADGAAGSLAELASTAKARLSDTYLHVTHEAVQMHGGVGVTDELDIGFFLKRARVTEVLFGDAAYHRDRYARLSGY